MLNFKTQVDGEVLLAYRFIVPLGYHLIKYEFTYLRQYPKVELGVVSSKKTPLKAVSSTALCSNPQHNL